LNVTELTHPVETRPRELAPLAEAEHGSENFWIAACEAADKPADRNEIPNIDEAAAKREAQRCLECGLICYKKAL
jgi:hypothetical protein